MWRGVFVGRGGYGVFRLLVPSGGGGADLHAAYVTDASRSCQNSSGFSGMMPPRLWHRRVFLERAGRARLRGGEGGEGGEGGIGRDLTLPSVGVKG